jgi:threonine aldolase
MALFNSDNVTGACPEVMDALIAANSGIEASYGNDKWSLNLQKKFSEIFETNVVIFPATSGTASNSLALSALSPVFGKIYCHELSHINTDECGAPEFFTGGAKLIPLRGVNGKIAANELAESIRGTGNVHLTQPAVVSMTQSCETGTVYQLDEVSAISEIAHTHGLKVHMDGARFANAVASLDVSPAEMTWKSGVDVLSFGGTKNGCFAAEAIVFFKPELVGNFPFLHKRSGQLISKMRFISAQLEAYLSNDLWLHNALHANTMASLLSKGLAAFPEIKLVHPTQSNEVFVNLPNSIVKHLNDEGYDVNHDELDGKAARFVAAWNTESNDIDKLLKTIAKK